MYMDIRDRINASFYGFANGDILFDYGLNETLSKMQDHAPEIKEGLLFGTRWNYNISVRSDYGKYPLWTPEAVHMLAANNDVSHLFRYDAYDFFFATRNYPFHELKPLVISRSGFDTYFAATTNNLHLTTVLATYSVFAIHQTDRDGNFAHEHHQNVSDIRYNRILIGSKYNYGPGVSGNAKFHSKRRSDGTVFFKCQKCVQKHDLL